MLADYQTVEELAVLYRYATDRERVLMLLGLNLGFAQSEIESFRLEDIKDGDPPHVLRLRRKTQKLCGGALWPETVAAIEWLGEEQASAEPDDNVWVVLSERGKRLTSQQIANQWNRLLDRVQKDQPGFRRLSFKHLRKTAYQLVLEASGSHEVAGTFQGRGKLSTDQYQDVYGRRLFDCQRAGKTGHDRAGENRPSEERSSSIGTLFPFPVRGKEGAAGWRTISRWTRCFRYWLYTTLAGRTGRSPESWAFALTHRAFRLRALRQIIKRGGDPQGQFEFLDEHEIIRDLSNYGQIVRASFFGDPAALQPLEPACQTGGS